MQKDLKSSETVGFLKSFGYAFSGIFYMLRTQRSARVHLFLTFVALILGGILHISSGEWTVIILAIGLVFSMELVNTSVEYLTDLLSPDIHPKAGLAKDIAAGAVLFSAMAAAIIGLIVFLPKLF
ncbi:MAG: diacylglycerol kinase family protein [Bacteroidales bacterium]|nr:diacylglycerol kinase family protein [Bacteroidales bacterium]